MLFLVKIWRFLFVLKIFSIFNLKKMTFRLENSKDSKCSYFQVGIAILLRKQTVNKSVPKIVIFCVLIPSQSPINPAQSEHHASLPTYLHNSLNLMLFFNLIWLNKVTANNKRTLLHISVTIIEASVLHISHVAVKGPSGFQ